MGLFYRPAKMVRGPRKHLKRLHAPKHWMLDKLGGVFAPHPSTGPHKLRECLPLIVFLRNRLKYALNYTEVMKILKLRLPTPQDSWMLLQLRRLVNISVYFMMSRVALS